jgi:membrane-bound lytic murein transglycosylase D
MIKHNGRVTRLLKVYIPIILLTIQLGPVEGKSRAHKKYDSASVLYSVKKEKTSLPAHHSKKSSYNSKKSFWDNLQPHFLLLHYTHKPAVQAQIKYSLKKSYQLFHTIRRSTPYIHYIAEEVKKRNLPAELIFLPFIESTYNPLVVNATSGASGLWQLTFRTAQKFGVRQDAFFDGKRDIDISTHVALDYLTYLNQLFCGNWLLTLAAYVAGEGNIKKAIDYNAVRGLSTSFWDLPLSSDVTTYVAKLLALSAIIKNPKQYKLELPAIHKAAYLAFVEVPAGMSLIQVARLAHLNTTVLKKFNPGFNTLDFIPHQPYRLLLPTTCIPTYRHNLTKVPLQALQLKLLYHTVQTGETTTHIAQQYHITVEQLCLWNGLKHSQMPPTNQNLVVIKMHFPKEGY